jgi:acetylornithine aminotransferase
MRGLRCRNAEIQGRILKAAFAEGLILLKAGRNTVRFLPPLVITRQEIDEGFLRLEKALESLS